MVRMSALWRFILMLEIYRSRLNIYYTSVSVLTSFCEFGVEPSGSIKCWKTIEWSNIW